MRSHNTICYYLSILIIVTVLTSLNLAPFYSGYVLLLVSLLAFITESVYFLFEKKKLKSGQKTLILLEKEKEYTVKNIAFTGLGVAGMAATFISLELRFVAQVLFIVLILWGIRGLVFKTQAMKSVRIDDKYIESGFLAAPFETSRLSSYEIDLNNHKLFLTNDKGKVYKIRIRGLEDKSLLEQLLNRIISDRKN